MELRNSINWLDVSLLDIESSEKTFRYWIIKPQQK